MTASDTEFIRAAMPLCASLDVEADAVSPERVVLRLDWKPELCTSGGLLHGGVLMALADSAGGACAFVNLPDGATRHGDDRVEDQLPRRGQDGTVIATATPLHVGSTTIVIETEVRHGDRLVAKVTQTQAVLRLKPV